MQHRRHLWPGIQATDADLYLQVGTHPRPSRGQEDIRRLQAPSQLAQQQLLDIRIQATGPLRLTGHTEAAIGLTLQQLAAL